MPKLSISNQSIITKLIFILCLIFILGAGIIITDLFSLIHVKKSFVSMVDHDIVQIIDNVQIISELNRIFSRTNLLIATFTERKQTFIADKDLILKDLKQASALLKKKHIQTNLHEYYLKLKSSFTNCIEINTILADLYQIHNNQLQFLAKLEKILIEKKAMISKLDSVESISLEQLHSIINGHRDVLYEILLKIIESRQTLMSSHQQNLNLKNDVLGLLQEFQLGFYAITTAWDDIHQTIEKIIKQTFAHKKKIITLFQKMESLQKECIALTESQKAMMVLVFLHKLNEQISRNSQILRENISNKVDNILKLSIILSCVIVIILVFLGAYIVRMIRPLRHLYHGAQKIGKGELDYHLEIKTKDEIGQLADAFNQMATNLRQSMVSINKYKQAEKELKNTQAQLIQSGKLASIGELAAGIFHELNQPIMVIRLSAQYYLKKYKTQNEELELWQSVEKNTSRMMRIINHLRTFSRQSKNDFLPADVHEILENSLLMLGQQFLTRNIEVIKVFNANYSRIYVDSNQLEQVFINILTNARDAINNKGQVHIITEKNDSGSIDILFTDTGGGISEADAEKVFDPFFTTKEVGQGTGLGLSISYGIVKDHSGMIEIAETSPNGTTFRINLPLYYE